MIQVLKKLEWVKENMSSHMPQWEIYEGMIISAIFEIPDAVFLLLEVNEW